MPEQCKEEDDGKGYSEQPKQDSASHESVLVIYRIQTNSPISSKFLSDSIEPSRKREKFPLLPDLRSGRKPASSSDPGESFQRQHVDLRHVCAMAYATAGWRNVEVP
jgi:hypothetical protein